MREPKVSVLMLTVNRPEKISRSIDSICRQSFADWELLIVQDGNNQATAEVVAGWSEKEPRIRYFRRGLLGTIAEASNFGLEQARGIYIAILDDDDVWSDVDKLAKQVAFLDSHAEYAACAGGYQLVDAGGRIRGAFLKPEHDSEIRSRALLANPIANSTALFRKAVNGNPVRYDARLKAFADWDFWLMLGQLGKLYNFPAYLTDYALWEGGSSFINQRLNAQAGLAIVWKHRHHYSSVGAALLVSLLYYGYSCLPAAIRKASYGAASSLKKALAAGSPAK